MAEYPTPDHIRHGHLPDPGSVRLDLWRLLTLFLADKEFARLTEPELDGHHQPLLGLHSDFAFYEITRILLSSAISLRVADDNNAGSLNDIAEACGELQPDLARPELVRPLTLREACNKVMHANRINFDVERLDGGDIQQLGYPVFLNPYVYLYGVQRHTRWRAKLDVAAYVRSATTAF